VGGDRGSPTSSRPGEGASPSGTARSSSWATASSRSSPSRAPTPRASTACSAISASAVAASGQALQAQQLEYSFRSSEAVLNVVDATFRDHAASARGAAHLAFRAGMPGRVDLWAPPVPKVDSPREDRAWTDPVDATDPATRPPAGRAVAESVADMIASGLPARGGGRRLDAPPVTRAT
jgi:hypothetical protein